MVAAIASDTPVTSRRRDAPIGRSQQTTAKYRK
jgi:hypothetical protein